MSSGAEEAGSLVKRGTPRPDAHSFSAGIWLVPWKRGNTAQALDEETSQESWDILTRLLQHLQSENISYHRRPSLTYFKGTCHGGQYTHQRPTSCKHFTLASGGTVKRL